MKALADGEDMNPGGSNSDNWRKRSFSSKGEVKELWKHKDRLYIDGEGILRLRFNGGRVNEANPFGVMEKNRIVLPESYRSEIMKLVHRSATAGHMGNNRTWRRARNNFWWPRMKQEIEKFVQGCEECGVNKHVNHPNKAPAGVTSIPGEPLEEMMLDFLGPFQTARSHSYRYILQTQDVFSKFIMFIPCVDAQASTAADAVMERWICTFGMPKRIRSDRGPHFVAEVFRELCIRVGITHKMGSPEHPESQAQLTNKMRCLCENNVEKWPEAMYKVQCSHNTSVNATTGFTPARLLFGREFILPEDLLTERSEASKPRMETIIEERDEEYRQILQAAAENLMDKQQDKTDFIRDAHGIVGKPYEVGDKVRYKLNPDVRNRLGGKISQRYSGPYVITEIKGSGYTYRLRPVDPSSKGKVKDRHFNLLKTIERREGIGRPKEEDPGGDEGPLFESDDRNNTPQQSRELVERENVMQGETKETGGTRRSNRRRTVARRLQVDHGRSTRSYVDAVPISIDSDSSLE